jgi:hypothetical protein
MGFIRNIRKNGAAAHASKKARLHEIKMGGCVKPKSAELRGDTHLSEQNVHLLHDQS